MITLTPKEKTVLDAVKKFFSRAGIMPTIREIKDEAGQLGLNVKSVRSIFLYLSALEEKGFIKRGEKSREIKILDRFSDMFVDIPVLGQANAGAPNIFAEEYVEGYLKVSKSIVKNRDVFAVQISGDSMDQCEVNSKRINDGDFVIVDPADKEYGNNDKVLVVVDGLATVKNYRLVEKNMIGLFPSSSNERHKPIYLTPDDTFLINGKVIDVLRA